MIKKLFERYLPDPVQLRRSKTLRFLGRKLLYPGLWSLNRRAVALAVFVGVFISFIPIPFQMPLASCAAVAVRCHLPLAVALVWISNPLTMPVIFYTTYKIGCFLLDTPVDTEQFQFSLQWLAHELHIIWLPLYVGSLFSGFVIASLCYIGVRMAWRYRLVLAYRNRRKKRKQRYFFERCEDSSSTDDPEPKGFEEARKRSASEAPRA